MYTLQRKSPKTEEHGHVFIDSFNERTNVMPPEDATSKGAKKAASKAKAARTGDKKKRRRRESYRQSTCTRSSTSAPRHWHQLEGREYHEQLRQRHLRTYRC